MMFNPTTPTAVLAWFVTGVFLLLYGVRLVSDALQRVISGRMQQALTRLSKYPLAAFSIGLVGTALMQSSAAMASLLVESVSAGLLPLGMAIVMVLGANVGSTLVVQLLALHITDYALELLGLGVAVALFTHRTPFRRPGRALFAFSLILLGLAIVGTAGRSLTSSEATVNVLQSLASAPLVLVVIGTVLAIVLNSSTASIGLVLTLAAQGTLQPVGQPQIAALALMLGANIGTTLLAMLASLGAGTLCGRRLALVHSGTKLLGAICLLLLLEPLATLLNQIWHYDPGTQVALAHMGFNLALAIVFVPLSDPLARLMARLLPDKDNLTAVTSTPHILDPRALATPEVAQGLATRETLRMADIVTNMFELSMRAFEERPNAIQARIEAMDDQVDELNAAIKGYLTQLDEEAMTDEQARRDVTLLTIVSDLEAIGDVINRRFMSMAHRRSRDQIQFSEEGWEDLLRYHHQIEEALQQVLAALAAHNPMLARKFLARKEELKRTRRNLHLRHIRQLRAEIPNSKESSAIYVDLLDAMSDVMAHISNIAYVLQEASVLPFTSPLQGLHTRQFVQMSFANTQQLSSTSQTNLAQDGQYPTVPYSGSWES
jgi:phosphate:Na+ symporter